MLLVFDPENGKLTLDRNTDPDDLLATVRTACRLGLVRSSQACKHLEQAARKIGDKLEDGKEKQAALWVKDFLQDLGKFQHTIDEKAYSTLREEAENLREGLEESEKHHHRRFFQKKHRKHLSWWHKLWPWNR